ncbi:hypothetical protein ACHAXT_008421 [Thalassiosira profunda]
MRIICIALLLASTEAFVPAPLHRPQSTRQQPTVFMSAETTAAEESAVSTEQSMDEVSFPPILEELRDVAMKLHTKEQAPREGQAKAPAKPAEPYVPTTQADYLQFLVDSHAVYVALEEIVNSKDKLAPFRNTGIERTKELEKDIAWMCEEFDLERPAVGGAGDRYAETLRDMVKGDADIPEFMCHYYNFYFAHLAGGRMIGKQMSKLLLDGKTLEFYKWGEDVNELKAKVKNQIEEAAKEWTREERDKCINATPATFMGGGAINGYLYGGSPH